MKELICPTQGEIFIAAGQRVLLLDIIGNNSAIDKLNINIGAKAQVDYIFIDLGERTAAGNGARTINLGAEARFHSSKLHLGLTAATWIFQTECARQCQVEQRILAYGHREDRLKITDNIWMRAPDSQVNLQLDGLMDESAQIEYLSDLIIDSPAKNSDSRIDMKLYLLGNKAQARVLPALKIANNEVRAGHGAGTFNLSAEDLFYLQSRGLAAASLKEALLSGLIVSFSKHIRLDNWRQKIVKIATDKILKN